MENFIYIFVFFIFLFFSPYILRYFVQWRLVEKCKQNGYIILSFDDGPGTAATPRLIALLKDNDIHASFFMLGGKIEGNESIIKEMHSLGHEIGSHGYAHLNAWKTNPIKSIKDISRCIEALSNIGIRSESFRPPHGKINIFTWIYLVFRRQRICWWSDDSGDTFAQLPNPTSFVNRLIKNGGGVVLMHDHHQSEERIEYIINSTKRLIELAKSKGLVFRTFKEVFGS